MAITAKGKTTLLRFGGLLVIVGAVFGLKYAAGTGLGRKYMPAFMVSKVAMDDRNTDKRFNTSGTSDVPLADLPSSKVASLSGAPVVRAKFWAWNSQMGCLLANGGPVTTEGSLMAKQGVKMFIERQDDNNVLMAELTALAKDMHDGNVDPTKGTHFIAIMGDGSAAFLAALNKTLVDAYGEEYRAEIIGSCGYSRGEDKLMGPEKWATNPKTLKGSVIAAVLRDGDWNIAVRYAGDNDVGVNPDETTYDPNLMNFVNASTYIDAAQKYVAGYCEDRKVVDNGKPTGETKKVCVEGAATWTPGDVIMAKEKGGAVTVISTKEYANQMPNVIIGIRRYHQTHKDVVVKVLDAFTQGGDQVLNHADALDKAAEISAQIYNEKGADAEYWKRYYIGVTEADATGLKVDLGGSKANNLADNLVLFGLADGTTPEASRFTATYTVFGKLVSQMYPDLVPEIAPASQAADLTYLRTLASKSTTKAGKAETQTYSAGTRLSRVVGNRNIQINFATGKATLTPAGERQLEQLYEELTINNLVVEVHGHTDNVGDPIRNKQLSEERAFAIKAWLENRSSTTFPSGRIRVFSHGDEVPLVPNTSEANRAKNRRVEITIGQ